MASVNSVQILGNLGEKPELRYTKSQTAVTTLNIATTETYKDKETTEWHRVVAYGKNAENSCKYLDKGSQAFIDGKLQTRNWEDKNGEKRYTTEIIASRVIFTGSKRPAEDDSQQPPSDGNQSHQAPSNDPPW